MWRGRVLPEKVRVPKLRGLARERLNRILDEVWDHRLTVVMAPAGAGKTTALSQVARRFPQRAVWYRVDSADSTEQALLAHLDAALAAVVPDCEGDWATIDDLVKDLDSSARDSVLIVIDDLHQIAGSPAEDALGRLVGYAPSHVSVAVATRHAPTFSCSRLRVDGQLLEVGYDDLRFRSWEVEHLFRDFYEQPMPPQQLAELERRTEGWAAGLQLFHLATGGKTTQERQRTLAELATRSRHTREYLADNVLAVLPAELNEFLRETCVLGRLTADLCDGLRGANDSAEMLAELERRQVFTHALDEVGTYRYHEVLRSHLETSLLEVADADEVQRRYCRAADLLEGAGEAADAVIARARGEDWNGVARLLGNEGESLADPSMDWVDHLPRSVVDEDPWFQMAAARRHVRAGCFGAAADAYRQAERSFGTKAHAETCRRERAAVMTWLTAAPITAPDWTGLLRTAAHHEPLAVAERAHGLDEPIYRLVEGSALMLAGYVVKARRVLMELATDPQASPMLATAGRLCELCAEVLADPASAHAALDGVRDVADAADVHASTALERFARALLALAGEPRAVDDAAEIRRTWEREGETWAVALTSLLEGIGRLAQDDDAVDIFADSARLFRALSARSFEAWARAYQALALARRCAPDAADTARAAESFARSAGVPGARAVALAAVAATDAAEGPAATMARKLSEQTGLHVELAPPSPASSPCRVSSFGGFQLDVDGQPIDLSPARPRTRATLRFLVLHAPRPVHREQIVAALWPDVDVDTATRNLQVAVSGVRKLLDPSGNGDRAGIERDGESYHLRFPAGSMIDRQAFDELLARARTARAAGGDRTAISCFEEALDLYDGELFPEDGPAEWVVEARERYRTQAAAAAEALAELHLAVGDQRASAAASAAGLQLDRYDDGMWRLLIEAHEQLGDHASATRARDGYRSVLTELGLDPALAG